MSKIPTIAFRKPTEKKPGDIDLTSRSTETWSRLLSPFLLGPWTTPDGATALVFENLWQFSKVHPQHADKDGNPTDAWYAWRAEGFANPRGVRHPMGRGARPLYCLWGDQRLGYIEARKTVYAPVYHALIRSHPSMDRLRKIFAEKSAKGETLTLLDFDVYTPPAGSTYSDIIHNPSRICGHGFVAAMTLENDHAWSTP